MDQEAHLSTTHKACSACSKVLDKCNFYKDSRKVDGLYSQCKACHTNRARCGPRKLRSWSAGHSYVAQWRADHPEEAKRRDRIYQRLLRPSADRDVWLALCKAYGDKCLRCLATSHIVPDHVQPVALGGDNSPSNLQPLCRTCNSLRRNGKRMEDFRPDGWQGIVAQTMQDLPKRKTRKRLSISLVNENE